MIILHNYTSHGTLEFTLHTLIFIHFVKTNIFDFLENQVNENEKTWYHLSEISHQKGSDETIIKMGKTWYSESSEQEQKKTKDFNEKVGET